MQRQLSTKFKAIIVPIVIFIVFGAFLMANILKEEQALPQNGWSRGIEFPLSLQENTPPLIIHDNGLFVVSSQEGRKVSQILLDSKFNLLKKEDWNLTLPSNATYWTNGERLLYQKGHKIFKVNHKTMKQTEVDNRVDGMSVSSSQIAYWKKDGTIYIISPNNLKKKKVGKTRSEIRDLTIKDGESDILLSTINKDKIHLTLYVPQEGGYQAQKLLTLPQGYNTSIGGYDFVTHKKTMDLLYSEYGSATGGTFRINSFVTFNLNDPSSHSKIKKLLIDDKATSLTFPTVDNLQISKENGKDLLTFVANGPIFRGQNAENIYLASQVHGRWLADKVSTTAEPSELPVLVNSQTLFWGDMIGNHRILMGASKSPKVVQKSLHLTKRDWSNGFSTAMIRLMISLLMFGYALLWIAPTGLFLIGLFMGNMTLVERNPLWIKWVSIGLFLVMQFIFIHRIFNTTYFMYAPKFLAFWGCAYLLPLILAAASWYLTKWVKNQEWGIGSIVLYYVLIDVVMLGFLVGPYTL